MLEPLHLDNLLNPLCRVRTLQVKIIHVGSVDSLRPIPTFLHHYRQVLEIEKLVTLGYPPGTNPNHIMIPSTFWSVRDLNAPMIFSVGDEEILGIKSILVETIQLGIIHPIGNTVDWSILPFKEIAFTVQMKPEQTEENRKLYSSLKEKFFRGLVDEDGWVCLCKKMLKVLKNNSLASSSFVH